MLSLHALVSANKKKLTQTCRPERHFGANQQENGQWRTTTSNQRRHCPLRAVDVICVAEETADDMLALQLRI